MTQTKVSAVTPTEKGLRVRDGLPLLMSVLAFTVSLTSLYYAALRGGNVTALTGPAVLLSHDPFTGAATVSVAVNLANTGARLITVRQLQLRVSGPDGQPSTSLPAMAQQKLNAEGEPQDDVLVGPITVSPRSETTRQLRFSVSAKDVERLSFTAVGRYQFQLVLELMSGEQEAEHWQLQLTEDEARELSHWRGLNVGRTLAMVKDEVP